MKMLGVLEPVNPTSIGHHEANLAQSAIVYERQQRPTVIVGVDTRLLLHHLHQPLSQDGGVDVLDGQGGGTDGLACDREKFPFRALSSKLENLQFSCTTIQKK